MATVDLVTIMISDKVVWAARHAIRDQCERYPNDQDWADTYEAFRGAHQASVAPTAEPPAVDVNAYTDRLRRSAIACLSTSLRHGSPEMLDALCELERAVYTDAVSPSAPDGLRDRLAAIIYPAITVEEPVGSGYWVGREVDTDTADQLLEDVLAVLPPAPRVDVDAVLKLIDEFAAVSVRSIFHPEVTPQINEQFAAIWAMLEGTA